MSEQNHEEIKPTRLDYQEITPSENQNLNVDETEIVLNWLNKHWKNRVCPICGSRDWNVNLDTGILPLLIQNDIHLNQYYPFIVINCSVCGYCFLMNKVVMGLSKPLESKEVRKGIK